jgi:RNA recognition motif-containing protein
LSPFGAIRSVKLVCDPATGARRPYCFVEYEQEQAFQSAMRQGTRLYLQGKRVIVDCERGRTVPEWLPRRLGGGLGGAERRFTLPVDVMEALKCKKRKRAGSKCGARYRGTLAEFARRRNEKLGIVRERGKTMGDRRLELAR